MVLNPLDIQDRSFHRTLRGYNPEEVDDFLDRLGRDYSQLYRENQESKEQLKSLQEKINDYKKIEETLKNTMLLAQTTSDELRKGAEKEAALITREAQLRAEELIFAAEERVRQLDNDCQALIRTSETIKRKLKNFLLTHIEMIDDPDLEREVAAG